MCFAGWESRATTAWEALDEEEDQAEKAERRGPGSRPAPCNGRGRLRQAPTGDPRREGVRFHGPQGERETVRLHFLEGQVRREAPSGPRRRARERRRGRAVRSWPWQADEGVGCRRPGAGGFGRPRPGGPPLRTRRQGLTTRQREVWRRGSTAPPRSRRG